MKFQNNYDNNLYLHEDTDNKPQIKSFNEVQNESFKPEI